MKSWFRPWHGVAAALLMSVAMPASAGAPQGLQTAPIQTTGQINVTLHITFRVVPSDMPGTSCVITIGPTNDAYQQASSMAGTVVQTTSARQGNCTANIPFQWHVYDNGNSNDAIQVVLSYKIQGNDNPQRTATGQAAFFSIPSTGGTFTVAADVGF